MFFVIFNLNLNEKCSLHINYILVKCAKLTKCWMHINTLLSVMKGNIVLVKTNS